MLILKHKILAIRAVLHGPDDLIRSARQARRLLPSGGVPQVHVARELPLLLPALARRLAVAVTRDEGLAVRRKRGPADLPADPILVPALLARVEVDNVKLADVLASVIFPLLEIAADVVPD